MKSRSRHDSFIDDEDDSDGLELDEQEEEEEEEEEEEMEEEPTKEVCYHGDLLLPVIEFNWL